MEREELTEHLVEMVQQSVLLEAPEAEGSVDSSASLIGPEALITSLGLVSFIADVELMLDDEYGLEVVLVSEAALSRSKSPFASIERFVDYILEFDQPANADSDAGTPESVTPSHSSITELDPDNREDVLEVAELHLKHFPHTMEAHLGLGFLVDFYYSTLVRNGRIGCTIARTDGRIVAFISYTAYPPYTASMGRFFRRSAGKELPHLARVLGRSLVTERGSLRALAGHLRSSAKMGETVDEGGGEVLYLATEPEYQAWVPQGGNTRIAVRLFHEMTAYFAAQGGRKVVLLVEKENKASNLLCQSLGCSLEETSEDSQYRRFCIDVPGEAGASP